MTTSPKAGKPRKEAFFVQIENADKTPVFVNVSAQLGKPLAFTKPLATTMMRIHDEAILFSTLKLFTSARAKLISGPLAMPPGPLSRLERRIPSITEPLADTELFVEIDDDRHVFSMRRDDNGVVSLEYGGEGEEPVFQLPRSPFGITLFLRSPRTGRLIVAGWQGYLGKPDTPETASRATALALNHLTGLAEFQVLAGITSVRVPASPGKFHVVTPTRKASDKVKFAVPVRLWTADVPPAPVAQGTVMVEVDLDNANPVTSQLLFHCEPDADVAPHFAAYKATFEHALSAAYREYFDEEELSTLVVDVTLGELTDGDLGRLRDAGEAIVGFDLDPRRFAAIQPAPAPTEPPATA